MTARFFSGDDEQAAPQKEERDPSNRHSIKGRFEDFIGIFETSIDCRIFLEYFERCKEVGLVGKRGAGISKGKTPANYYTDSGVSINYLSNYNHSDEVTTFSAKRADKPVAYFLDYLDKCLTMYQTKYESVLTYSGLQHNYFNIQRTQPSEGYHVWHHEHGPGTGIHRVLVTMLYLNDDFEGGETEFLYQSLRVKPKAGTFLIWPAAFTHTHRGNPPIGGDKYVVTGWLEAF